MSNSPDNEQPSNAPPLEKPGFCRAVVEHSFDGILILDPDQDRILDANPNACRMLGYTEETLLQTPLSAIYPEDGTKLLGLIERARMAGSALSYDLHCRTRSGEWLALELSASLINANDQRVLLIARDLRVCDYRDKLRSQGFSTALPADPPDGLYRLVEDELRHQNQLIGDSAALQQVLGRIEAVAQTSANVLILGESGVGKELVAQAIHEQSERAEQPLVKVNCASIPQELFESEFFGHVKGAFTGAHRDRQGRCQQADGGTLFLDEVGEIPLSLQAKLLRVLQEAQFEPVGTSRTQRVDLRVIAATNRDLKREVEARRFREDLYYRLSVFPIEVPPLRERREDIEPLARHILTLVCRDLNRPALQLTLEQAEALKRYAWPGNVRELSNVLERAVILAGEGLLRLDMALPQAPPAADNGLASAPATGGRPFLTEAEFRLQQRNNMIAALESAGWRVSGKGGAAELLGIKPSTLYDRIKTLGIIKPVRDQH